jgi:hypothetical protein
MNETHTHCPRCLAGIGEDCWEHGFGGPRIVAPHTERLEALTR